MSANGLNEVTLRLISLSAFTCNVCAVNRHDCECMNAYILQVNESERSESVRANDKTLWGAYLCFCTAVSGE